MYNPISANTAPEPHVLSLLPLAPSSFGRELPNLGGCQEVYHSLVAFRYGKKLRDLHVSASAHFPACIFSHRLPLLSLVVSPPAAVAEEVLPRLVYCPSTPPAFVVISMAEPL